MSQNDMTVENSTGATVRADINSALQALATNNSGSSAPSTTFATQFFADTNAGIMKLRNTSNNGYVNLFTLAGGIDVDSASNFNEDVTFTGASANIIFDKSADDLIFNDNAKAVFGTSSDGLEIFHNASDSIINDNGTGSLKLQLGGSTKAEVVSGGLTVTGTVTATTFSGNATTATTATNATHVSVADNESTNENNLVPFIEDGSATGNVGLESDGDFTYNPSTGTVTATKFVGDGSGLTGISAGGTTINNNADNRVITGSGSANTLNAESNVTINSDGDLLVGRTSTVDTSEVLGIKGPSGDHCVFGMTADGTGNQCMIAFNDDDANFRGRISYNHNGDEMGFRTAGGNDAFQIRSDSKCFFNVVNSNMAIDKNTTGTIIDFINGGNSVGTISITNSSTSYNTSSDYRLKENVVALTDGITRLKTLKPYRFNFISDKDKTVDGFLAHEVTAVPEAITGTKDEVETVYYESNDTIPEGKAIGDVKDTASPVYQGIDQSKLVPLLTAALQEAVAKIELLETKVAALEAG